MKCAFTTISIHQKCILEGFDVRVEFFERVLGRVKGVEIRKLTKEFCHVFEHVLQQVTLLSGFLGEGLRNS